jgi:hypothetical protein
MSQDGGRRGRYRGAALLAMAGLAAAPDAHAAAPLRPVLFSGAALQVANPAKPSAGGLSSRLATLATVLVGIPAAVATAAVVLPGAARSAARTFARV